MKKIQILKTKYFVEMYLLEQNDNYKYIFQRTCVDQNWRILCSKKWDPPT